MRRLDDAPDGGEIEGGWLFTMASDIDDDETQGVTCWKQCHVAAPYSGAWFDYGELR